MTIHKPKTACDFCGKLVSRMKEHLETMHKDESEMRFRCELGIKIFDIFLKMSCCLSANCNAVSLRCDLCGKGFSTNNKLRDHDMNVHLKLKPYTCR